jgi:hypothetical protein
MFLLEVIILLKNVKTYCPIFYKLGVTHFQGISRNLDGSYSINVDVIDLKESLLPIGYFMIILRNNKNNQFIYSLSNSVKLLYNNNGTSSSNSVADNKVVGLYIGNDKTKVSYQSEIV